MLDLLLDEGASLDICVEAIAWGRGFDWETTLFDATPISYAQMGLLPQFHRSPPPFAQAHLRCHRLPLSPQARHACTSP
jgi:hypothetical protein